MRKKKAKLTKVFLDAAYAIALSSPTDQYHGHAKVIAEQLEADGTQLITTSAVLLEIGNALAKQRYRAAAIELLDSLQEDSDVEIVPISEDLYERAFQLYRERQDKEWGLTDCISFVVMNDRGLMKALTTDEHFKQAGFQVLLS